MRRILLSLLILIGGYAHSQITYTMTPVSGAWTANTGFNVIHPASTDDAISAQITFFPFCYGGQMYNKVQVSTNGVMFLGTTAAGSNTFNDLNASTDRPAIAPLWDDLATGASGNVNYVLSGVSPNRILSVEWKQMEWTYSGTTWAIEFQVKLYETSNRIEFCYNRNGNASANIAGSPGASIGLSGPTSGDFYSLGDVTASPTVSKLTETNTLATKPLTGQIYRWDPNLCSGPPTAGVAVATQTTSCTSYTPTISLSGGSTACGVTYQWQSSSTSATGPWTNFGTASTSQTFAVSVPRWFRCISSCGASTVASSVVSCTVQTPGVCSLCGVLPITLPYSASGQTTCGQGNDLTTASNACSSNSYLGGEDVIYTFTPSTTGLVTVTYSNSGSSGAAMLWQGCPNSGGTCMGNATGVSSFSGNQMFCSTVTAGQPYFLVIDSWPSPACNGYNISITAPISSTASACALSSYNASSTTYNFEAFAGTNAPSTDDVLFNSTVNLGFNFCYGGNQYSTCYIASNGAIVFDAAACTPNIQTTTYAGPGVSTGYVISAAAPVNNTSIPRNAILGPWHDIDPSVGGLIEYATIGTAPNRRFVVSYDQVPMFSSSCNTNASLNFSGQIKIYETSGNIEVHVRSKQLCSSWNGGYAVMGLHNYNGTIYRPPVNATAHNYPTNWTMTNTAYLWSAPCASCTVLPIEFKSFYGQRVKQVNKVFWETSLEEDVISYSLMRSIDAENFTEITKVSAKNKASLYSYDDIDTKPGALYYYKVISNEKNGEHKSTNVIPLGADLDEVMVSGIYPNPVQSDFVMSVDGRTETELTVNIYDVVGKLVKSFTRSTAIGVQHLSFSVPELPSGSYMLEVRSSDTQVITQQKLIKVD